MKRQPVAEHAEPKETEVQKPQPRTARIGVPRGSPLLRIVSRGPRTCAKCGEKKGPLGFHFHRLFKFPVPITSLGCHSALILTMLFNLGTDSFIHSPAVQMPKLRNHLSPDTTSFCQQLCFLHGRFRGNDVRISDGCMCPSGLQSQSSISIYTAALLPHCFH